MQTLSVSPSRYAALAAILWLGLTTTVAAQFASRRGTGPVPATVEFVARGGRNFDLDAWSVGAQVRIPFTSRFILAPNGDLFFDGHPRSWQGNIDLVLRPTGRGPLTVGAGLGFVHRPFPSDSDVTVQETKTRRGFTFFLTLLPLASSGGPRVRPLLEARWVRVNGHSPFQLLAGLAVALGSPSTSGRR